MLEITLDNNKMVSTDVDSQAVSSQQKPDDIQKLFRHCTEEFVAFSDGCLLNNFGNYSNSVALLRCSQKQAGQSYNYFVSATASGERNGTWAAASETSNYCYSTTGRFVASFVNKDAKPASQDKSSTEIPKFPRIHIWDQRMCTIALTLEIRSIAHGEFWAGSANCSFNHAENKLIYIAEEPSADKSKEKEFQVDQFAYEESWGEACTKYKIGRIYIANLEKNSIIAIQSFDKLLSYTEPRWLQDGVNFVCVARDTSIYRLGLRSCNNRPSTLYLAMTGVQEDDEAISCEWLKISRVEDFAAWNAVIIRETEEIVEIAYLSLQSGSEDAIPHEGSVDLVLVTLKRDSGKFSVVNHRKIKFNSVGTNFPKFNGLFIDSLHNWFDGKLLYANNLHGPVCAIIGISLEEGTTDNNVRIIKLVNANEFIPSYSDVDSLKLLDQRDSHFLIAHSSPCSPPMALIAVAIEENEQQIENQSEIFLNLKIVSSYPFNRDTQPPVSWSRPLTYQENFLKDIKWNLIRNRHILLSKQNEEKELDTTRKLAIALHGGPHACYTTRFSPFGVFFAQLGFDVLYINYSGSTGFGQDELLSLLGEVGKRDVDDAMVAIKDFLAHNTKYSNKPVLIGGSHGGFLVCHLIGQYPDMFSAASACNPVTDIAAMLSLTDIPDWCVAEACGEQFDYSKVYHADEAVMKKMRDASPLKHVGQVKTPLLLGIGTKDMRVPHFQGLQYYKLLKANGVAPCRLLVFPDDHSLSTPVCDEQYWVNSAVWFNSYV